MIASLKLMLVDDQIAIATRVQSIGCCFAMALLLTARGKAQQPKPMTVDQAKQFAMAAVAPKLKRLPAFGLEPPQKDANGLYIYNAIWQGLPHGSVEVGFYAVDPITGTVWNAVMECMTLSTPPLEQLQRRRQKQLGMSAIQLRKFRSQGPQCS